MIRIGRGGGTSIEFPRILITPRLPAREWNEFWIMPGRRALSLHTIAIVVRGLPVTARRADNFLREATSCAPSEHGQQSKADGEFVRYRGNLPTAEYVSRPAAFLTLRRLPLVSKR
jgi:hypothetical protein